MEVAMLDAAFTTSAIIILGMAVPVVDVPTSVARAIHGYVAAFMHRKRVLKVIGALQAALAAALPGLVQVDRSRMLRCQASSG
jgi:hypothetical protein